MEWFIIEKRILLTNVVGKSDEFIALLYSVDFF
jgi:hypothetical protein